MGTRNKAVAIGAVVAAGVGYAIGILTAPKSGKETRKDISKGASKARIQGERQLKKLHSEISDVIKDGEAFSKKTKTKAKKEVDEAVAKAKKAQKKAKELLSALHDGDADDPNLQAFIEEVKHAKKNLVKYLKKK
jgi:gas vesicle protein